MQKKAKKIFSLVQTGIFILLLGVILFVLFPLLPPFRGFYHTRTVLTGSMEPTIKKGSLIINKWIKDKEIKEGDIITFRDPKAVNVFITHRVYKIEQTSPLYHLRTKGDANQTPDGWNLTQAGIEGKVIFTIPFLGYLIEFFKTPLGFALFVLLPLGSFLLKESSELKKLIKEAKSGKKKVTEEKGKLRESLLVFVFLTTIIIYHFQSSVTFASFNSNNGEIAGITLQSAENFPGDVVINEVMWMGSTQSSSDEWIELRNMTGNSIPLTGWTIEGAGSGSSAVTLSGTIPVNGYFLISHYSQTASAISDTISVDQVSSSISLNNDGEKLLLKNAGGTIIDETPSTAWPAGYFDGTASGLHQSMERNDDPGSGWHTCTDSACNDTTFWDSEGNNYGTPKAVNLSENDSSFSDFLLTPTPTATPNKSPAVTPALTLSSSPSPTSILTVSPTPPKEPALDFFLRGDKKAVGFKAENVADFETLSYEITYETNKGTKGMMGEIEIENQETIIREDLLLATCSAVKEVACIYDTGIKTIHLKVALKDSLQEKILEKEINYD